jgi:hypothetical protein
LVDDCASTGQHRGLLVETINAIWAEDDGVAAVDELFERFRQLVEDDLGVAARGSDGSVSPVAGSILRVRASRTLHACGEAAWACRQRRRRLAIGREPDEG